MSTSHEIPERNGGPSGSSATSRSLLGRVQADEPEAWTRLVNLYAPLVLHWCHAGRLQDHDVADIFQDVFQAVLVYIGNFRKERKADTFRGWLRRITQNKIRDHFRKSGRDPHGEGGSSARNRLAQIPQPQAVEIEFETDDPGERALFARVLDLVRREFEERTWSAFWKTAVEGRTPNHVGADLSMSPGAVRVAKSRVLHRIREELGDLMD